MHSISRPTDPGTVTGALYRAAAVAGYAPSIHDSQPWRWRLAGATLDLFAVGHPAGGTDRGERLAVLSCGAALHHARLSLAAHGWHAEVTRLPDAADPDHLARLRLDGSVATPQGTARRAQTIRFRHTDRHPVDGAPVGPDDLAAVSRAVEGQHTRLLVLRPDQIVDLAGAPCRTRSAGPAETQWRAELARWIGVASVADPGGGPDASPRDTIPDNVIPLTAPRTTAPRTTATRTTAPERVVDEVADRDRAATFVVLYGPGDARLDWLRAGEALSAGWLAATELGVSVLPLSAPVEVTGVRADLRRTWGEVGRVYLVLRLGRHTVVGPPVPRLPAAQTIDR